MHISIVARVYVLFARCDPSVVIGGGKTRATINVDPFFSAAPQFGRLRHVSLDAKTDFWRKIKLLPDKESPWLSYTTEVVRKKKNEFTDDLGLLRSGVVQKLF